MKIRKRIFRRDQPAEPGLLQKVRLYLKIKKQLESIDMKNLFQGKFASRKFIAFIGAWITLLLVTIILSFLKFDEQVIMMCLKFLGASILSFLGVQGSIDLAEVMKTGGALADKVRELSDKAEAAERNANPGNGLPPGQASPPFDQGSPESYHENNGGQ